MKYFSQIPKNVDNLQASHVYFKRQMICQCIIAESFASGRKQTSHGVVRMGFVIISKPNLSNHEGINSHCRRFDLELGFSTVLTQCVTI